MFSMTPAAVDEIVAAARRSNADEMALRVAARQVADGSIEFGMGFDEQREDDEPLKFDRLTVLVGSRSRPLLEGAVLDYVEAEPGRCDFVFIPAADSVAAGCGSPAPSSRGPCGSGGCGNCA